MAAEVVAVRDSKFVEGPTLAFGYGAWRGFVGPDSTALEGRVH
nr:DUF397 domain-containing protein [Actinophytocola xinjiangensis]